MDFTNLVGMVDNIWRAVEAKQLLDAVPEELDYQVDPRAKQSYETARKRAKDPTTVTDNTAFKGELAAQDAAGYKRRLAGDAGIGDVLSAAPTTGVMDSETTRGLQVDTLSSAYSRSAAEQSKTFQKVADANVYAANERILRQEEELGLAEQQGRQDAVEGFTGLMNWGMGGIGGGMGM